MAGKGLGKEFTWLSQMLASLVRQDSIGEGGLQDQDKWKEPRNRRTSDAEKKAPYPHPHAGFKGEWSRCGPYMGLTHGAGGGVGMEEERQENQTAT